MKKIVIVFTLFFQITIYSQITMHINVSDSTGLQKKIRIELRNDSDEYYALPIDTTGLQGSSNVINNYNINANNRKPTVHLQFFESDRNLEYDYNFASGNSEFFDNLEQEFLGSKSIEELFIGMKPWEKVTYTLSFNPMNFNNRNIYHELFYITPNIIYDLNLSFFVSKELINESEKEILINDKLHKVFIGTIVSNKVMVSWAPKMFEHQNNFE